MNKIIIIISIIFIIPVLVYAGHGIFGEKQLDLENACSIWEKGDDIPKYLLKDTREYNPMSIFTPSYYIYKINNIELLWALLLHPEIPESNFDITALRLLDLQGLKKFGKKLLETTSNQNNDKLRILKSNFKDKCFKVYYIFINEKDMSYDESEKVLELIDKDLKKEGDLEKVYDKWSTKYRYTTDKGYERTKIGKGGDFYFSKYNQRMFPKRYARTLNNETKIKISSLKKGATIIIREYMHEDDKDLGNNIFTDTNDRMTLYIILEEY